MEEKSLRERLNGMFTRYNYVGICNITSKEFKWSVALEQNEILNMDHSDNMSTDEMVKKGGGSFLPGDAVVKDKQRVVSYELAPGEKKMVPGEAAYVLIDKIYRAAMREKYGRDKAGLSKLMVPSFQDEMLPRIIVGPIIRNVGGVINDLVNKTVGNIEGFSSVEAYEPPTLNPDAIMGEGEDLSSSQSKLHVKDPAKRS